MKKITVIFLLIACAILLADCASTINSESTGQYLDSAAITTKIKSKLAGDVGFSTLSSINVTTYKGVVQLSGFVTSQKEIDEAVRIAKSVAGVKAVENSLLIRKMQSK